MRAASLVTDQYRIDFDSLARVDQVGSGARSFTAPEGQRSRGGGDRTVGTAGLTEGHDRQSTATNRSCPAGTLATTGRRCWWWCRNRPGPVTMTVENKRPTGRPSLCSTAHSTTVIPWPSIVRSQRSLSPSACGWRCRWERRCWCRVFWKQPSGGPRMPTVIGSPKGGRSWRSCSTTGMSTGHAATCASTYVIATFTLEEPGPPTATPTTATPTTASATTTTTTAVTTTTTALLAPMYGDLRADPTRRPSSDSPRFEVPEEFAGGVLRLEITVIYTVDDQQQAETSRSKPSR